MKSALLFQQQLFKTVVHAQVITICTKHFESDGLFVQPSVIATCADGTVASCRVRLLAQMQKQAVQQTDKASQRNTRTIARTNDTARKTNKQDQTKSGSRQANKQAKNKPKTIKQPATRANHAKENQHAASGACAHTHTPQQTEIHESNRTNMKTQNHANKQTAKLQVAPKVHKLP